MRMIKVSCVFFALAKLFTLFLVLVPSSLIENPIFLGAINATLDSLSGLALSVSLILGLETLANHRSSSSVSDSSGRYDIMKFLSVPVFLIGGISGYLATRAFETSSGPELKTDFNWQSIAKLNEDIYVKTYYEMDGVQVLHGDQYSVSKTENRDDISRVRYDHGRLTDVHNYHSSPHPGEKVLRKGNDGTLPTAPAPK